MTFDRDNELERFGEGLAPLFLAISLWVGGMAIFLLMPPFSREAAARGAGPVRLLLGGLLPALAVGLAQSAITIAGVPRPEQEAGRVGREVRSREPGQEIS